MNADHRHVTQNGGLGMQFVDPRFNDGNDSLVNIVAKENREEALNKALGRLNESLGKQIDERQKHHNTLNQVDDILVSEEFKKERDLAREQAMVAEAKEEEQNQRYRTDQNANLNTTIDSEEETDEEEGISGLGEQDK